MNRFTISLILACGLALGGCGSDNSNGTDDIDLVRSAGSTLLNKVRAGTAGANAPAIRVVVTRALLDETPGEVMEVVPELTGLQDFLSLIETRRDSTPGKIEVWKSSDNRQVIMREGVLVGTKGLGGDMRSAEAAAAIAGFDGQGGGGQRLITLDRQDGTAQTVSFSCDMTQLGRETIQIVDQRVSTFHMREDCIYNKTSIRNDYWVETAGGRMRKSRQWAGLRYGYINFTRLKN